MSLRAWLTKFRSQRPEPRLWTPGPDPPQRKSSGEYVQLYDYLYGRHADTVVLTFAEIEDLLGFLLPDAARQFPEWWTRAEPDALSRRHDAWTLASRTAVPNLLAHVVVFDRA